MFFLIVVMYFICILLTLLVPDILKTVFQYMIVIIYRVLATSSDGKRTRLFSMRIFLFFWATLVYCPCACWTWSAKGWCTVFDCVNFTGSIVHQTAGHGALMNALILERRNKKRNSSIPKYKSHPVISVILDTMFLCFG